MRACIIWAYISSGCCQYAVTSRVAFTEYQRNTGDGKPDIVLFYTATTPRNPKLMLWSQSREILARNENTEVPMMGIS